MLVSQSFTGLGSTARGMRTIFHSKSVLYEPVSCQAKKGGNVNHKITALFHLELSADIRIDTLWELLELWYDWRRRENAYWSLCPWNGNLENRVWQMKMPPWRTEMWVPPVSALIYCPTENIVIRTENSRCRNTVAVTGSIVTCNNDSSASASFIVAEISRSVSLRRVVLVGKRYENAGSLLKISLVSTIDQEYSLIHRAIWLAEWKI